MAKSIPFARSSPPSSIRSAGFAGIRRSSERSRELATSSPNFSTRGGSQRVRRVVRETDSAIVRAIRRDLGAMDSLEADMKKHPLRYIAF